jgi:hypothetical protein
VFLTHAPAIKWFAEDPARGRVFTDAAHTVVNTRFAQECGARCDGLRLWSPYSLPVGEQSAEQARYVADVRGQNPGVDVNDVQVMRSYLGAQLLVEGLWRTGANLTRARFQSSLNSGMFLTGLSPALRWTTSSRYANVSVRPYSIATVQGSFAGFRVEGDYQSDPTPGTFPAS